MGYKNAAIFLGILVLFASAHAQTKVAFVDSDKILKEYKDAEIARATLQQSINQWKHELDSLKVTYREAETEFKAQQPMLSKDAFRARQNELFALRKQYETFAKDIWGKGGKIDKKHNELFAPVIDKMTKVIEQLATEDGIDIVLDIADGNILYADVTLNMTSTVLKELNREYATTAPTFKKQVAVFGIAALDQRSQTDSLDIKVREYVLRTVKSFETDLNYTVIKDDEVKQILNQYGESMSRELTPGTAHNISQAAGADYAYFGTVQTQNGEIVIKLQLINSKKRITYPLVETRVPEKERALLSQTVSDAVAKLQANLIAEAK